MVHAVRGPGRGISSLGTGRISGARSGGCPPCWTASRSYRSRATRRTPATVTGQALDAFEGRAFRNLVAKYRAPAVAVVVRDGGEAALAVWRNGFATEWSRMPIAAGGDPAATRIAVSKALADLVRSAPLPSYADRDLGPSDRSGDSIRISDWRMGPAGGAEYRAVLAADDRDDVVGRLSAEGSRSSP